MIKFPLLPIIAILLSIGLVSFVGYTILFTLSNPTTPPPTATSYQPDPESETEPSVLLQSTVNEIGDTTTIDIYLLPRTPQQISAFSLALSLDQAIAPLSITPNPNIHPSQAWSFPVKQSTSSDNTTRIEVAGLSEPELTTLIDSPTLLLTLSYSSGTSTPTVTFDLSSTQIIDQLTAQAISFEILTP